VDELEQLAQRERLNLRVCRRSEVCLLVLEGLPSTSRLRELLDEARHRVGDVSTNWIVADHKVEDATETSDHGRSVEVARNLMRKGDDWVASQSLESLFVLGAMAQSPLISKVVTEAVGALVTYDRRNRRNLLETLQVFLDESCNTSAAARRLFLNRHSLMYRLRKIEELSGFSLKEPADRFFLQACVRLYRYRLVGESSQ
jgi:sugar diacid utilization regulator